MIQIRCKIKSFDRFYIFLALNYLSSIALFINATSVKEISLPTKIKRFTVMKSPHKYKSSREQFQYTRVKKCFILNLDAHWKAALFILLIKNCEFPGIEIELETISLDYFVEI